MYYMYNAYKYIYKYRGMYNVLQSRFMYKRLLYKQNGEKINYITEAWDNNGYTHRILCLFIN